MSELYVLTNETVETRLKTSLPSWKVLIVDDDDQVHAITKLILSDFEVDGRKLELHSAYSAHEAQSELESKNDFALILLDVVMETDTAGLDLVQWIREDNGNQLIRIILRTGQPGIAPESEVIARYRINDYKAKTELTQLKLFTAVTVALRSYQELLALERSREGFRKIVAASAYLFSNRSWDAFYEGLLLQLTSLLRLDEHSMYLHTDAIALKPEGAGLQVLAATGRFHSLKGSLWDAKISDELDRVIRKALELRKGLFESQFFVEFFTTPEGRQNLVVVEGNSPFGELDRQMLQVFLSNAALANHNLALTLEIENAQKEIMYALGGLVEQRSLETGQHVRRVAELVAWISSQLGFLPVRVETLRLASALHDVGKVAVPDSILGKSGPLSEEERAIMAHHTISGWELLKNRKGVLAVAAEIARSHHEHWDGSGYPDGLSGESIPLSGRITAAADVFDALFYPRSYKEAWAFEDILTYFEDEKGHKFDPKIVEIMMDNRESLKRLVQEWGLIP